MRAVLETHVHNYVSGAHEVRAVTGAELVLPARDGYAFAHRPAYAAAHIPGSVNIELNSGFASYVGWLLPFNAPIVLVLPDPFDEALTEAMTQLVRIGWSRVEGYLPGAVARWREHGEAMSRYHVVGADDLCDARHRGERATVLDVRQEL